MDEIIICDKDICTGYVTPQARLEMFGAKIVPYETGERWVIDGKLVYIERTPINWLKNITKGGTT